MDIVAEEWKTVIGFPYYEVSSFGRVRSVDRVIVRCDGSQCPLRGVMLKPSKDGDGYLKVSLGNGKSGEEKTIKIHILVAAAFLGTRPAGREINHIDANKTNNSVENIEFMTHLQNIQHAWGLGLFPDRRGEANSQSTITSSIARDIHRRCGEGGTARDVSSQFGVSEQIVHRIIGGRTWRHLGLAKLKRRKGLK